MGVALVPENPVSFKMERGGTLFALVTGAAVRGDIALPRMDRRWQEKTTVLEQEGQVPACRTLVPAA